MSSSDRPRPEDMFEKVVENAFDFLDRAVDELPGQPKYFVLHVCAAVELILKARIMREHWSLVYADPGKADAAKFIAGDFQSVSIPEAKERLAKVVGAPLSPREYEVFDKIRLHRNRLAHFFHPDYGGTPGAANWELCVGWYYLHRLVAERWRGEFASYQGRIFHLNDRMLHEQSFLEAKYKEVLADVKKEEEAGHVIHGCPVCSFEAAVDDEQDPDFLVETTCYVCGDVRTQIRTECPGCGGCLYVYEAEEGKCTGCGKEIGIEHLVATHGSFRSPKDEMIRPSKAYCPECYLLANESAIELDDCTWLCLCCLEEYDRAEECEFCGSLNVGLTEDSYLSGCANCDGRLGWDKD